MSSRQARSHEPRRLPLPALEQPYIKADHFFDMPIYTEDGVVKVDGKAIGSEGKVLKVTRYLNGVVN